MKRILAVLPLLWLVFAGWAGAQDNQGAMTLEKRVAALEAAQEGLPGHQLHIVGYMSTLYHADEVESTFSTLFAPIFLYKSGDRFLFEGELEFVFEGSKTDTGLEYSQLDYMFNNNATVVAGKMLLPFGRFGERGHPSWINKFSVSPIIYTPHRAHEGSPSGVIPVMSDFGVQIRGGFPTGNLRWNYAAYVVNGPRPVAEQADGQTEGGGHGGSGPVDYMASVKDDNNDKAFGFRMASLPMRGLEIGLSYYTGKLTYNKFVDKTSEPGKKAENPITLAMVDFGWQQGALQVQGEYVTENTSALDEYVKSHTEDDPTTQANETATEEQHIPGDRSGYWVETAYRLGGALPEVALRYGATAANGKETATQAAIGITWWLESSLAVKVSQISNTIKETGTADDNSTFYVELAYGF